MNNPGDEIKQDTVKNLGDSKEARIEASRIIFDILSKLDPTKIHCAMVMVVMEPKDGEIRNEIHNHAVGTTSDISKMLAMQIARMTEKLPLEEDDQPPYNHGVH